MLVRKTKLPPKKKVLPKPKPKLERSNGHKTKWELDKEWTQARIDLTRIREKSATLLLAKAREDLVEKELITKQACYIFVAIRQKLLAIPTSCARKLLHKDDVTEVVLILKEAVYQALRELSDFPKRVVDSNWLATLDEDETYKL